MNNEPADLKIQSRLTRPKSLRNWIFIGVVPFVFYLAITLGEQRSQHAAAMGFGTYPDEAAHYVSGLMVHDYLFSGMKQTPIAYASQYYLRLPMIAIGHWPPFFYVLQAVCMSFLGISRGSVLILMAIVTALAAFTVFRATLPALGWIGALFTGGTFLAIPIVRWNNNLVMSDTLIGLLVFWAALAFGRFLDSERFRDGICFSLIVSLAFLTKPAAGCLAFLFPLALLFARRVRLLGKPAVWGFALIILVSCAPWYIFVGRLSFYGHSDTSVIDSAQQVLSAFCVQGMQQMRFLLILSMAGVVACLRRQLPITGKTAVLLALPVAVLGFSVLSGVEFEPRFLIPAILPMLTLAGYGAAWLAAALPIRSLREPVKVAVLCGFSAIAFAAGSAVPKSPVSANDRLPDLLKEMRCKSCPSGAILVVGPSGGADGRIIAGFAESLPYRPQEILLRAVKVLARADWSGGHYSSRFHEPDQIIQELDSDGVSLIALDVSQRWGPWRPHEQLLLSTIARYPDRVELIYSSDRSAYRLYRFLSKTPPHVPGRLLDNLKEKVNRLSF